VITADGFETAKQTRVGFDESAWPIDLRQEQHVLARPVSHDSGSGPSRIGCQPNQACPFAGTQRAIDA